MKPERPGLWDLNCTNLCGKCMFGRSINGAQFVIQHMLTFVFIAFKMEEFWSSKQILGPKNTGL